MTKTTTGVPSIIAAHRKWLRGEPGGTRADLRGADLTGADLTGANLTGANLTRANLRGANLMGANLTDASLTDADLRRANLMGADLTRAGIIHGGMRSDGYTFIATREDASIRIHAGCRDFLMPEAREHWQKTRGGTPLGDETMAILDHIERMAKILGWMEDVTNG